MDKLLYVAMSGASNVLRAQTIAMQNLANVNTVGFREDLASFYSDPVTGGALQTRVYAMPQADNSNLMPGSLTTTGRSLDAAIHGDGWFVVQDANGKEALTRSGEFQLTSTGGLVTATEGLPVIGDGGPIAIPPAEKIEIGVDGTISIRPVGTTSNVMATVGRLRLVKPKAADIAKGASGYFYRKDGQVAQPDSTVKVQSGVLEQSNVSAISQLMNVISLSREFELEVKMMKSAENSDSETNQVMSLTN